MTIFSHAYGRDRCGQVQAHDPRAFQHWCAQPRPAQEPQRTLRSGRYHRLVATAMGGLRPWWFIAMSVVIR